MTEPLDAPSTRRSSSLVRDVAVLVLAGAALGIGFNALQLAANATRALPWLPVQRRVVSLGLTDPAAAVTLPGGQAPVVRAVADSAAKAAPADTVRRVAPADSTHARRHKAPPAALPIATGQPHAMTPATAPAAAASVPAIPDSRDPIEVKLDVVRRLYAADGALFVDARSAEEYAAGHIAGAINLPFDDVFKKPELAKGIDPKGRPIVCYCGGGDCELSRNLAFSMIDAGFRKVLVFTDGMPGWSGAGQPVHKGAQP